MSLYRNHLKRVIDVVVAATALIVTAPLLLIVALLVAFKLGRPVLFAQERSGLGGRPFRMVKFRTMTNATSADGRLLPDAERLVPFGRWLRATSIDELPELWNIVRGEMGLVGPRPYVHVYHDRYNAEQRRRFSVRPGLTSWAMVNGRNAVPWDEKLALDTWYADRVSFGLDLKIMAMTVGKVLRREGASSIGALEVPEFMGTQSDDRDRGSEGPR